MRKETVEEQAILKRGHERDGGGNGGGEYVRLTCLGDRDSGEVQLLLEAFVLFEEPLQFALSVDAFAGHCWDGD